MQGVAVAVLTEDTERLPVLRHRLDGTQIARAVFSYAGFPTGPADSILRQIQDVHAEVVFIDIDPNNEQRALAAIQLIRSATNDISIFAVGVMTSPGTIVAAMVRVHYKNGTIDVNAGQAVVAYRGEWVKYSTPLDGGAEYIAVCLPAFSMETVHRDN